jgi:asparagine synthase (glutamine-hydrolysing)
LGTGLIALAKKFLRRDGEFLPAYPYPNWLNPDFERDLDLRQHWAACWSKWNSEQLGSSLRQPQIASAIMTPDWNTDDFCMNCDSPLTERRCPFLDPRLVELVMSLPTLPWLFNKHILRKAMADRLPEKILHRPKTLLGSIHNSLLRQNVLEKFSPTAEISQYVDQNWINALPMDAGDASVSYVNLRPRLLNEWMQGLHQ